MIDERELTVEELQRNQPWVVPYSEDFKRAGYHTPHNTASHAVLHAMKSLGKIATVLEAVDHRGQGLLDAETAIIRDMAADLFTIAMRFANLYHFSLIGELRRRVFKKNGVDIFLDRTR